MCTVSLSKSIHTSASFSTVPGVLFSSVNVDIVTELDGESDTGTEDVAEEGEHAPFVHLETHYFSTPPQHPLSRTSSGSGEARSARALLVVFWARSVSCRDRGPSPRRPRPERSVLVYIKDTLIRFQCFIGILLNWLGLLMGCRVQRAAHASRCTPDEWSCGRGEGRLAHASSTSPVGHSHLSIPFAKRLENAKNNSEGSVIRIRNISGNSISLHVLSRMECTGPCCSDLTQSTSRN
jgi:hypothetical protein